MTSTDQEFHENPGAILRFVDSKEAIQVQVREAAEYHRPHRYGLCHNRGRPGVWFRNALSHRREG